MAALKQKEVQKLSEEDMKEREEANPKVGRQENKQGPKQGLACVRA